MSDDDNTDIAKIDDILQNFNFFKVWAVMTFLDWKWYDSEATPTIERLRKSAKSLLQSVSGVSEEYPNSSSSSGGFRAECIWTPLGKIFHLSFVVTEWSSDYDYS